MAHHSDRSAHTAHTAHTEPETLPPAVDLPVETCRVLGTRVGFTCEGPTAGLPLVLIHGVPGGAHDYRYLAPLLAESCRVYRLELPGFGTVVDADWPDYSPSGRASLVTAFTDALGVKEYAVLGHSAGGPAALATAALDHRRVRALILLASVGLRRHQGVPMPPTVLRGLMGLSHLPILRTLILRQARATYRKIRFPGSDRLSLRELRIHASHVTRYDFPFNRWAAATLRCPTLVAYAEDDHYLETAISEELIAAIPGARAARYATGGHNLQKTRARALAARILSLVGEQKPA